MQYINIFPTLIGNIKIDPNSYDKKTIVEKVIDNYRKQPERNFWDKDSKLHHYYGDWENQSLSEVDFVTLKPIYNTIIENYMKHIHFSETIEYSWSIANLAVNSHFMKEHDHFQITEKGQCLFSCIHYIKFNKELHAETTFNNPLHIAYFPANIIKVNRLLKSDVVSNSTYFHNWVLDSKEDDFIIFPSYLKHVVYDKYKETKEPRIVSVINVVLHY